MSSHRPPTMNDRPQTPTGPAGVTSVGSWIRGVLRLVRHSLPSSEGGSVVSSAAAFNLVEVSLAVAIAATGMLVVLGLTSGGLDSSRKVADETVVTQIAADMLHDRELTPYASPSTFGVPALNTTGTTNVYFSMDGLPTTNATASSYFWFRAEVKRLPALLNPPDLACVVLTAKWPLKPISPYGTPSTNASTRTFFTQIARTQ